MKTWLFVSLFYWNWINFVRDILPQFEGFFYVIFYLLKLLLLLRGGYYRGSPHKQLMKVQSYK